MDAVRPAEPELRSSFDPRAIFNQQQPVHATAAEPKAVPPGKGVEHRLSAEPSPMMAAAVQRNAPTEDEVVRAEQRAVEPEPLIGAEEAALRDIAEDPAVKERSEAAKENFEPAKSRRKGTGRAGRNASSDAADQQDDRQEQRRAKNLRRREAKEQGKSITLPAPATGAALDRQFEKPVRKREPQAKTKTKSRRQWSIPWTALSFVAMVLIPAAFATFYYVLIASPQFQVETQFAVRGSNQSAIAIGIPMLPGSSGQTGDSYIVTSYVESLQLIRDVKQELGIDLRQFYTHDHIDWLYKIDPAMPLEKFTDYWRDMTDVSFNSTTGNTTLYIYAFTADDSKAIADAVLKVSEKLVNELSESNRKQVMQVASRQVDRAEERLRKVQSEVRTLRETEKVLDPNSIGSQLNQQVTTLQSQVTTYKTRLSALLKEVDKNAPQARSLRRTIDSLEAELLSTKNQLEAAASTKASATNDPAKQSVADVLNKFEELTIEQGFATQAYTTALAAFESSIAESQRQERYFATFVSPLRPEIALYPLRWLDSFIAFLVLLAIWLVSQFLYRSFRDHAV